MGQIEVPEKPTSKVHESKREDTPQPVPTHKHRLFWEKAGIWNILILFLGTIAIFLGLAFLLFLWIKSRNAIKGGQVKWLWRAIVYHRWATRVVTTSTVLIRLATTMQLGIFTAIVAALLLERVGVARADLPKVSIIRCSNSGPQSLVLTIYGSVFSIRVFPYAFLLIIAVLDAFVLQFASTILLTDFADAEVVLGTRTQKISFGLQDSSDKADSGGAKTNPYGGSDYWKAAPAAYDRFAEYKREGSQGANYVDTGSTYRGFLPFRDATARSSLQSYTGPMMVIDARVVCVKPTLSNISFDATDAYENFPTFLATYNPENAYPDLQSDPEGSFRNCTIPTSDSVGNTAYWATALCSSSEIAQAVRLNGGIRPDYDDSTLPHGHTSTHVLLNATGDGEDWLALKSDEGTLEEAGSSAGPWTRLQGGNVSLAVSLCFFNPLPTSYKVSASSKVNANDRVIEWNSQKKEYNTSDVRRMLGTTDATLTADQRGLLQLAPPANWTDAEVKTVYQLNTTDFMWDTLQRRPLDSSGDTGTVDQMATFSENAPYDDDIHRSHASIVQTILQQTGNPALALQALWTILLQMSYYDFLPEYDISAPATYGLTTTINISIYWGGFAVVLGFIGLHFLLVLLAFLLFLRTEMSLLGNSWQVISQVVSTDTADIVHHGATSTDAEMEKTARDNGVDNEKVRIARCENSGRAQATSVRRRVGQA